MTEEWRFARAEQRSDRRSRLVRIGLASTLPTMTAMRWFQAVQRQLAVDLEISEGAADAVAERCRRGRCDVALYATREPGQGENAVTLWREPYVLAAATEHLVATRDRWSVKDLAEAPFVLRAACEGTMRRSACSPARASAPAPCCVRPTGALRGGGAGRIGSQPGAALSAATRHGCSGIREVALDRRAVLAWQPEHRR